MRGVRDCFSSSRFLDGMVFFIIGVTFLAVTELLVIVLPITACLEVDAINGVDLKVVPATDKPPILLGYITAFLGAVVLVLPFILL